MEEVLDNVLAEFAALNMLTMQTLRLIAMQKPDPRAFLAGLLETGLQNLAATNYSSVPPERKAALLENARARYTDMIVGIRVD